MDNNNKEMIEELVSQILDDYHDDKIINQQALFSQPDKILQPGQPDRCSFGGYHVQSAQAGSACPAAES